MRGSVCSSGQAHSLLGLAKTAATLIFRPVGCSLEASYVNSANQDGQLRTHRVKVPFQQEDGENLLCIWLGLQIPLCGAWHYQDDSVFKVVLRDRGTGDTVSRVMTAIFKEGTERYAEEANLGLNRTLITVPAKLRAQLLKFLLQFERSLRTEHEAVPTQALTQWLHCVPCSCIQCLENIEQAFDWEIKGEHENSEAIETERPSQSKRPHFHWPRARDVENLPLPSFTENADDDVMLSRTALLDLFVNWFRDAEEKRRMTF